MVVGDECGLFAGGRVVVGARYLPTRSQTDGLDRLRDLLRDVSYNFYVGFALNKY